MWKEQVMQVIERHFGTGKEITEASHFIDDLETYMHHRFATKRVHGEWFQLDQDELDEVVANILIFATFDNGCLCELKLNNKIEEISNMNSKAYPGLTQRIVFKCCDFVDEYL